MMDKLQQKIRDLLKSDKSKTNLVLILGVAAMFLLSLGSWLPAKDTQSPAAKDTQDAEYADASAQYISQLETRLASMIQELDGAGDTCVMLTLAQSGETVYALDTETDDASTRETHIVLDDRVDDALVEAVTSPQIQGVAILCEGGDDIAVQARITEMVKVLTGIGTNNITVGKMA